MAVPKFFKIILDSKEDSLRIPPVFTKRYGHRLPNPVFLKVPFGTAMEVKLVWSDGKTLILQKGWKEFRERYSIGFGHFLVFEYNGKSEFNVVIFDKSAVEINYPSGAGYNRGKRKAENRGDQNDTIQISDDISHGVKHDESTSEELSQCWDRAVAKETSIAYHNALGFVSAHNTSKSSFFIRQMQHSYVSGRFSLRVPIPFAKRNLPCKGATITLVTDGKRWSVGCSVGEEWASLSRGWKDFVQDNGLKFGDACVFEVANYKKNKPVWNVIIFRS